MAGINMFILLFIVGILVGVFISYGIADEKNKELRGILDRSVKVSERLREDQEAVMGAFSKAYQSILEVTSSLVAAFKIKKDDDK